MGKDKPERSWEMLGIKEPAFHTVWSGKAFLERAQ